MKLIKMLGLAVIAALASMAVLGAGSAMATGSTTLCKVEKELTCASGNQYPAGSELLAELLGTALLLTDLVTVHCLESHGKGVTHNKLGTAPTPLEGELTSLTFTKCFSNEAHTESCTVTVSSLGLLLLLKTGENVGTVSVHGTLANVRCGFFINCNYESNLLELEALGLSGSTPAQLHANKTELTSHGGFLCPEKSEWDALYDIWVIEGGEKKGIHIAA